MAAIVAIAITGAVVGCDRGTASTSAATDAGARDEGSAVARDAADANDASERSAEVGSTRSDRFADARPLKGKPIGHTSVVFKVGLEGNLDAAYKPRSRRGKDRYKGEIAAYRLACALGLSNVPPAIPRSFDRAALREAFAATPAALELLDKETVADPDGRLPGALIPWLAKLELLPLESAEWRARWQAWLGTGALADADRPLAAQISTMIVFDWLTANWDRWSGGNVGIDRASGTLLFIDNDGAFFEPPPPAMLASQLAILRRVQRFSARLLVALEKLDGPALAAALGEQRPGSPLLPAPALKAIDSRRRTALDHMRAAAARARSSGFD